MIAKKNGLKINTKFKISLPHKWTSDTFSNNLNVPKHNMLAKTKTTKTANSNVAAPMISKQREL